MKERLTVIPLSEGSFGKEVYKLQQFLEYIGLDDFVPTGYYGPKTKRAVTMLQKQNKLEMTGIFDKATQNAANSTISRINRLIIYGTAISAIGRDVSPNDIAPDEYGCAESLCDLMIEAGYKMPVFVSTSQLYVYLANSTDFIRVDIPQEGDIIISPTGYGNGRLSNGHVGLMGINGNIMSNSSSTGKFEQNYTIAKWKERYQLVGGYPVIYFRKL